MSAEKFLDPKYKTTFWRGWYNPFYHNIPDKPEVKKDLEAKFAYVQEKIKNNDFWSGMFCEVAQYGQERDTAQLAVKEVLPERITLDLRDKMDDSLFDYPLTVKVRLSPSWRSVKGIQVQGQVAKNIDCKLVQHEGANYALIQVVPNRGLVILTPQ